jgi:hypothetical protein
VDLGISGENFIKKIKPLNTDRKILQECNYYWISMRYQRIYCITGSEQTAKDAEIFGAGSAAFINSSALREEANKDCYLDLPNYHT